jgi:hypothetical protein
MKRLFKKLARTLWRISAPVRRPVIRKFDHHMMRLLSSVYLRGDAPAVQVRADVPANLDLLLNSVVRELARLQDQVEMLQGQIYDLESSDKGEAQAESRLAVIGEID